MKGLDLTDEANIGSYVGVPLRFSDGRLYGTLCTYSHSPNPSLKARDLQFMRVLARMVAEQLEREELEAQKQRLAVELAGLQALLAALEARDGYSGEHSKTVMIGRVVKPSQRVPYLLLLPRHSGPRAPHAATRRPSAGHPLARVASACCR